MLAMTTMCGRFEPFGDAQWLALDLQIRPIFDPTRVESFAFFPPLIILVRFEGISNNTEGY